MLNVNNTNVPIIRQRLVGLFKKYITQLYAIYRKLGLASSASSKNLPVNAGDIREVGLIPGSGRSPGGGHGNPLQYSCLENPMDRGAWKAIQSIASQRVRHD